jgi:hypothetical protein
MTSALHNDILFNAAISGITAGLLTGKDFGAISAAVIADPGGAVQQAAILAAATEVDTLVAFDALLSVSSSDGTMLVTPFAGSGNATALLPFFSKPLLLASLCHAAFASGTIQSAVGSTYSVLVAGIVAQYTAAVGQQKTS